MGLVHWRLRRAAQSRDSRFSIGSNLSSRFPYSSHLLPKQAAFSAFGHTTILAPLGCFPPSLRERLSELFWGTLRDLCINFSHIFSETSIPPPFRGDLELGFDLAGLRGCELLDPFSELRALFRSPFQTGKDLKCSLLVSSLPTTTIVVKSLDLAQLVSISRCLVIQCRNSSPTYLLKRPSETQMSL